MKVIYDSKFKTDITLIGQGEFFVSSSGQILSTTLGSCIAVCICDEQARVGGMNHYMLPEPALEKDDIVFGKAKYGINSMEILINEILKLGALRTRLKAKVFGGANMFSTNGVPNEMMTVGQQNIKFAQKYLNSEGIQILKEDVGGFEARKIYFDPATGHVKLFRLGSHNKTDIETQEMEYRRKIKQTTPRPSQDLDSKITLF